MCLRGVSLVNESLLEDVDIENLSVHVVWSNQLGADESHLPGAMRLMGDERARHYWDRHAYVGTAFAPYIENLPPPAWDVWMLFAPGTIWEEERPPEPDWWEHQLTFLSHLPDRRLDPDRFAAKALELSNRNGVER